MVFYSLQKPVTYTASASIFPLNSTTERSTTSVLSALMGINDGSKSFSNEAAINIIELAQSRAIREAVATMKVPQKMNKTIAELLFQEVNTHKGLLEKNKKEPQSRESLINWATRELKNGLNAGLNKNNSFVLNYTGRSPELVRIISYGFIEKISSFYINLKREKAKLDYDFATDKVDSLRNILASKDRQMVSAEKRTMFTDPSRLEYSVPKENLILEKQMIHNQYATAVTNQQNASYVLQKATPVIKVLDKPEPPYDVKNRWPILFGAIGFVFTVIIATALVISTVVARYLREEIARMAAAK